MMGTLARWLARANLALLIPVLAAGTESRAGVIYSYTTAVEITAPFVVGPDAAVGEAFGHLTEGLGNGTLQMEGHNGAGLSGSQLIDIADVGIASNRPPGIAPDTGTFSYLVELMLSANGQTRTFNVTGTINVTSANTALAESNGSFTGVTPTSQVIGGTPFQVVLTGAGTGYTGPTINAVPLTGHIVVGIVTPDIAAVPEPSSLALAGTATVAIAGFGWLRRRLGAAA